MRVMEGLGNLYLANLRRKKPRIGRKGLARPLRAPDGLVPIVRGMGHHDSESMAERIVWTLAVAAAGAIATAAVTQGMTLLWRRLRGTDPPSSIRGVGSVGTGVGRKVAQRFTH